MENLIFNTREPKFITNRRERLRLEALVAGNVLWRRLSLPVGKLSFLARCFDLVDFWKILT